MKKALKQIGGKVTGMHNGVSGNLTDCDITVADRTKGINIEDLIA